MLCAKVKPLPGEVCVFAGPEGATSFMSTVFPGKKDWWTGHSSSHTAIWKMNFFNLSRWTCHLNENNFCNPSPYLSFQVKTSAWERLYLPLAVWQLTVKTFWMRCVTIITRFFFFQCYEVTMNNRKSKPFSESVFQMTKACCQKLCTNSKFIQSMEQINIFQHNGTQKVHGYDPRFHLAAGL